jgi:hypothetical protein
MTGGGSFLQEITKLLSKVAAPFCILTSNEDIRNTGALPQSQIRHVLES